MEVGLSLGNLINAAEKGMALEGAKKMDPAVHHVITIVVASCIDQNNKRLAEQLQELGLAKPN